MVKNWEKEISKWLGKERLSPLIIIGSKDSALQKVNNFITSHYRCLILSYETFRTYAHKFNGCVDLLIFDEGHKLKNMNIKTFQVQFKLIIIGKK